MSGERAADARAALQEAGARLRGLPLAALTGAGCSTDSGIPDYRSPGRQARTPIQGPAFVRDPAVRARYWARSLAGWPRFAAAAPNAAHLALADLERRGALSALLTQNVDRLHRRAGSRSVLELHGALEDVRCLGCGDQTDRAGLQPRLEAENPAICDWIARQEAIRALQIAAQQAPDGDADLPDALIAGVVAPDCRRCGGVLKPDVVFFGDNLPPERTQAASLAIDSAGALIVLGTSLQVWSGWRLVRRAAERRLPILILNRGPTRGDDLATWKVEAGVAEGMAAMISALISPDQP